MSQSTPDRQSSMAIARSVLAAAFRSRSFAVGFIFLVGAVALWHGGREALGLAFVKQRVELIEPLETLPEQYGSLPGQAGPRFLLARNVIPDIPDGKDRLRPDVEETLGTDQYISWFFVDMARSTPQRLVLVRLHVAYYTGIRDAVPHVADVCMLAGGASQAGSSDVVWHVPDAPQEWRDVTVRQSAFEFARPGRATTRTVVFYVFNVNGRPINDRNAVRLVLGNPFQEHCYYAKIEIAAMTGPQQTLSDEEAEAICRDFFAAAAPTILQHMASAEAVERLEQGR